MAVFITRMPAGIPGDVSRPGASTTIETAIVLGTNPPLLYGIPVAVDASTGKIRPIGAGDTVANVYGLLVRAYPSNSSASGVGDSVPPTSGIADVLKKGYMSVKVNGSTSPVKNGSVYVRTVTGSDTVIGGFSAASDATNNFVLTGAYFTGGMDANGNSEIKFN